MTKDKKTYSLSPNLVSIIIPVYNGEKYIGTCVKSIIGQDYQNLEAIFVNDGSTDKTEEICEKYSNIDNRIKILHQKHSGISAARNLAIKNSKGDFIFFLDVDDYTESNAIDSLVKKYNETQAELIIGNFRKIKNGIEEKRTDISFLEDKLLEKDEVLECARNYLRRPNKHLLFAFSWARLFKSSIIKNNRILFNPKLSTFEDVAFNFDYLKYVDKAYFVKDIIYNHLVYDSYTSATLTIRNNTRRLFGYLDALVNTESFLTEKIGAEEAKKEIGHAKIYLSIIQLVRACGQINDSNKKEIYKIINELVNDSEFREGLDYYTPLKGDSKIIPFLMKLKLVRPIIEVCKYKANKRYKNVGAKK